MKKIMFSDAFQLTQAVLEGRKTQTRRIVSERLWDRWTEYDDYCGSVGFAGIGVAVSREYNDCEKFFLDNAPYKLGEVVAVAQSYKDAGVNSLPEEDDEFGCYSFPAEQTHGWNNKLYVRSELMPHRIRITDVRVEKLQAISYDDCLAEGVYIHDEDPMNPQAYLYTFPKSTMVYYHPREAYAALIDKISGRGTWQSNPYVFAYTFELVK